MKHMNYTDWRKMVISTAPVCDECKGSGSIKCEWCEGIGRDVCAVCLGEDNKCHECQGTGKVDCIFCDGNGADVCPTCHGEGKVGISGIDYRKQLEKDENALKAWLRR